MKHEIGKVIFLVSKKRPLCDQLWQSFESSQAAQVIEEYANCSMSLYLLRSAIERSPFIQSDNHEV